MDPVTPRLMRPGTQRDQEVKQHSKGEAAATHGLTPPSSPLVVRDGSSLISFVPLLACDAQITSSMSPRGQACPPVLTASTAWRHSPRVSTGSPSRSGASCPMQLRIGIATCASRRAPAYALDQRGTRPRCTGHGHDRRPVPNAQRTPQEYSRCPPRRSWHRSSAVGPPLSVSRLSWSQATTEGRSAYASHGRTSATCASRIRRRSALDDALPDAAHLTGEAGTWPLSHPVSPHARLSLVSAEGVPLSSAHVSRAVLRNHGGSRRCSYGAGGSTDLCASQVVRPPSDRYAWA